MIKKFVYCSMIYCWLLPCVVLAGTVYTVSGNAVEQSMMTDGLKQKFYDIEMEAFLKKEAAIKQSLFDEQVLAEVKKTGRNEEEIIFSLLGIKKPTDKELNAWYESNKARIPYPYEQVKGQIIQILTQDQVAKKKQDYVEKLMKKKKIKIALVSPKSPVLKISSTGYPSKGKKGAKIKIVEFADYYCPHCKEAFESFKKIMKKYSKKVELTFMDFPIRGESSHVIARGAYCAGQQGKFWQYHEEAFNGQSNLSDKSPSNFAMKLKLDQNKFKKCISSAKARSHVDKSLAEGRRIGVSGTPAIYVNGVKLNYAETDDIEKAIKSFL